MIYPIIKILLCYEFKKTDYFLCEKQMCNLLILNNQILYISRFHSSMSITKNLNIELYDYVG